MIPTPTEIKYFIEAYQTKHISRAALRLGVTQPTLTQAIKSLEQKLSLLLFVRTKQGVLPTKDALRFYGQVTKLSECWLQIQDEMNKGRTELEGLFTVGCHQSVAGYVAPPLLQNLDSFAPNISIRFVHDFSRKITERILAFELDLGYVVNPSRHPDLVFKKIGNDQVTFYKAKHKQNIPKRIFADGQREQVESLLGLAFKRHFSDWRIVDSSSLEVVRTLTARGLGVGVLPERVAFAEERQLEIYDPKLPVRPDEIFLAYRKEMMTSKAAKALLKLASIKL